MASSKHQFNNRGNRSYKLNDNARYSALKFRLLSLTYLSKKRRKELLLIHTFLKFAKTEEIWLKIIKTAKTVRIKKVGGREILKADKYSSDNNKMY